jgi:hypothetical protein
MQQIGYNWDTLGWVQFRLGHMKLISAMHSLAAQNEYFTANCINLGAAEFCTFPNSCVLSTSPFTAAGPKNWT